MNRVLVTRGPEWAVQKQKMFSVRQKRRPPIGQVSGCYGNLGDWSRSSSRGWNLKDGSSKRGSEDDNVAAAPRAATRFGRVADESRRSGIQVSAPELTLPEKRQARSIGRPEGIVGVVGSFHRSGLEMIERAQPQRQRNL